MDEEGHSQGTLERAPRWLRVTLVLAVVGLAFGIRLHRLHAESLWLDEAYTYERATMAVGDTIQASIDKQHVPTYFVLMHYWLELGDDEDWMRMPSVIFGALTVLVTLGIGRLVGGLKVGLAAGLLLAMSPLQVRYAQEARMYTMLTFAAALAMWGLVHLLARPDQLAHFPPWKSPRPLRALEPYAAYFVGAVSALYLHNTAGFLVAACGLGALVLIAAARGHRARALLAWTVVNVLVLLAWAPWFSNLLHQTRKVEKHFWAKFPSASHIWTDLEELFLYDAWRYEWVEWVLGALFLLGLLSLRRRLRLAVGLTLLAAAAPGLVYLVSLKMPIWLVRIMLWGAVPFCVVAACGIFVVRHRAVQAVLLSAALAAGYYSLDRHFDRHFKPPWRRIATHVAKRTGPNDLALSTRNQEALLLSYYYDRKTNPIDRGAVPQAVAPGALRRVLRGHERVMLVDRKDGRRIKRLERRMPRDWKRTWQREYRKKALLRLYERRPRARRDDGEKKGD